jgi:hypothetical protein
MKQLKNRGKPENCKTLPLSSEWCSDIYDPIESYKYGKIHMLTMNEEAESERKNFIGTKLH